MSKIEIAVESPVSTSTRARQVSSMFDAPPQKKARIEWSIDMATRQFQRRLLQRRPSIECVIGRLPRSAWKMFAPYHYMSAELHRGAKCFGLWANGRIAGFSALIPCPVSRGASAGEAVWRFSRSVTLPDWQGLGLIMVLGDAIAADFAAAGKRCRKYPAHPAYIRALDRSSFWRMTKRPGNYSSLTGSSSKVSGKMGGRPCAVFEYVGPAATESQLV